MSSILNFDALALDGEEILSLLPHRQPMLFIDSARIDRNMTFAVTEHLFRPDEPYFKGHFPGDPVVPGVVLIECMAQAARLLLNLRAGAARRGCLVGVESAKFNQVVRPNDCIRFDVRLLDGAGIPTTAGLIYSVKCSAYSGKVRCARAHLKLYQAQNVSQPA